MYFLPIMFFHRKMLALNEEDFWKNVRFSYTLYAKDIEGVSLFDEDPDMPWNITNMDKEMSTLMAPSPGISTPMGYIGTSNSWFVDHTEDGWLSSGSYLHFGANKEWYVVYWAPDFADPTPPIYFIM